MQFHIRKVRQAERHTDRWANELSGHCFRSAYIYVSGSHQQHSSTRDRALTGLRRKRDRSRVIRKEAEDK